MTLRELFTITGETINIMTSRPSPFPDIVALTVEDALLATDLAFTEAFLNSDITSIEVGADGSLCVKVNYKMED